MDIRWTGKARRDLARIYVFSLQFGRYRAEQVVDRLSAASSELIANPQAGALAPEYAPREVRNWQIDNYDLYYEYRQDEEMIYIVDLWHIHENR